MRSALLAAGLVLSASAAEAQPVRQRLGAYLFGEPVGEVRLTLSGTEKRRTLTYRSNFRVVRNAVVLRQEAFIEVEYGPALLSAKAKRCTGPDDGSAEPTCRQSPGLGPSPAGRVPALAAELLLAMKAPGQEHCLDVIDEESATEGTACARVDLEGSGARLLTGSKLGEPFRARVDARGMLVMLELPQQGARFEPVQGELSLSDADLFSDPVPSTGDVDAALRRGRLRLRLTGPHEAIGSLMRVKAPGVRFSEANGSTIVIESSRAKLPKKAKHRRQLDHAALLVARAKGGHADCQSATHWFIGEAKKRGWKVRPAVGLAWVDGRFAFHSWAIVQTASGDVPVDPLLAQVPADAGHIPLATAGESAGAVLVAFRRGLSAEVLEP